jgi:uncharacterized protein (DUF58 family)
MPEQVLPKRRLRISWLQRTRQLYILPTRYGALYACMLLAMLAGAINYTLSLGFALTFLLAGLGLVAMLHAWRNLAGITLEIAKAEPVFAGEDARFEITASEHGGRPRYALQAQFANGTSTYTDIAAHAAASLRLALPTQRRGWLPAPRLTCSTEFPLLLFHVWSHTDFDIGARCLVYPQPAPDGLPLPPAQNTGIGDMPDAAAGDDDFAGHRIYQLGDSPKRVDWKASSREQGMLVKQYHGAAQRTLWLDWEATPGTDAEQRISQLTRWVIDADARGLHYGLRLPTQTLASDTGEHHYRRCLRALALMD